jgi:hypothetical protein
MESMRVPAETYSPTRVLRLATTPSIGAHAAVSVSANLAESKAASAESNRAEPRPGASLRTGRKIDWAQQIDKQIDDKVFYIKYLDNQRSTRPAERRLPVLREAAGRIWIDISRPSPMVFGC